MEIKEWRPEPARPSRPEPPRKDRSALMLSLVFAGTFIVSLALFGRHELADYIRQRYSPASPVSEVNQTSDAANIGVPGIAVRSATRSLACIPANVLSAAEIEQLNVAIAALPASSQGMTKALSADSFDPHKMTPEQARETLQILAQIRGPLGDKALRALNQSVSEGPCKIHPENAQNDAPATPTHAPSAAMME